MGKVEQYRHYAAECFRLSQHALDPEEKDTLLAMAEAWRRLAEWSANIDHRDDES
jgi:hypothetical protein